MGPADEQTSLCTKLGVSSGLMIIMGYPGELLTEQDELAGRWKFWCLSMIPFMYVVYTLLIGLKAATNSKTSMAQWIPVISWLTFPVVYVIPMMGAVGAQA